ncbi:MAG: hypothetical protein AAGG01_02130 [Planctomycetota bacterium]
MMSAPKTNPFDATPTVSSSSALVRSRWHSVRSLALLALGGLATAMWAAADLIPPPPGDDGSDPTVGTLPMVGDSDDDFFDQTITLRGLQEAIDQALVSATGDGATEVIDLGGGNVWIRFYGDVSLELDLDSLNGIEVEIFTGFEGDGMTYAIGEGSDLGSFGSARRLGPGGEIGLDPLRLMDADLLDSPLHVMGLHFNGVRTHTSVELMPNDAHVVLRQDV